MENSNEIIQLKGPHLKTCGCNCGIQFRGRRNQKYFNNLHKSEVNNAKRDKKMKKFNPEFIDIRHSYEALEKGLKEVDENGWIYIGKLIKLGFNPDCPTKRVVNKNGVLYKCILDIAFRLSEKKDHVQIIKLK